MARLDGGDGSMADLQMSSYGESHLEKGGVYDAELTADAWDSYMHHWEARHLEQIVPSLLEGGARRALDFACGTGRITEVVAPMVAEVVGVDVSESMLAVAREKLPSAKFVHADLTRERPELGDFDLVTSFRFLGNAEPALRTAALRALNRQQRPGSYLIVDNHRNPMCLANWIHRVRGDAPKLDLSHRRLTNLLGACGYELVDARPIGVWQYRAKLMASAGSNPEREERLEQLFRARRLAPIAPASVVVARKAQDLGPGE